MKLSKAAIASLGLIFVIIVATIVYFVIKNDKQNNPSQSQAITKPSNINEFSDGSLGISFYLSKDFERISEDVIKKLNPTFIYGFKPKDVDGVSCYISQTKRTSPGDVTQEYLKNGTWEVIKNNTQSANMLESKNITIGDVKGVSILFSYKENGKDAKQIEYIGTNDKLTTFAFCNAINSLYDFYKPTFEEFLNSLKITQ